VPERADVLRVPQPGLAGCGNTDVDESADETAETLL
jgi:hypothetical protein